MIRIDSPQPLPPDLFMIELAYCAGAASQRAGFAVQSNVYRTETSREGRLSAWAFDLGWREAAHLESFVLGRTA